MAYYNSLIVLKFIRFLTEYVIIIVLQRVWSKYVVLMTYSKSIIIVTKKILNQSVESAYD